MHLLVSCALDGCVPTASTVVAGQDVHAPHIARLLALQLLPDAAPRSVPAVRAGSGCVAEEGRCAPVLRCGCVCVL